MDIREAQIFFRHYCLDENSQSNRKNYKRIFDQSSTGEDYGFNRTVVPVRLAQYGNDQLISRSQAKRLLARVELFKTVLFDFAGIDTIGQGFSDEIFRVFAKRHPEIELIPIHANSQVKRMIAHAMGAVSPEEQEKPASS
ncbi:MAG: STAS-like domain-containing protein [Acidiferrobacterales bacterium]